MENKEEVLIKVVQIYLSLSKYCHHQHHLFMEHIGEFIMKSVIKLYQLITISSSTIIYGKYRITYQEKSTQNISAYRNIIIIVIINIMIYGNYRKVSKEKWYKMYQAYRNIIINTIIYGKYRKSISRKMVQNVSYYQHIISIFNIIIYGKYNRLKKRAIRPYQLIETLSSISSFIKYI